MLLLLKTVFSHVPGVFVDCSVISTLVPSVHLNMFTSMVPRTSGKPGKPGNNLEFKGVGGGGPDQKNFFR